MASILFFCPQMEALARKIVVVDPEIRLGDISWKRFEDGYPNLFFRKEEDIRGMDAAFLASFDEQGDIFEQLSAIYTLPRLGPKHLKIILPYYSTATMERVDDEGQVATAKTLARMLSVVPPCRGGPAEIVIHDIHALQERFYFGDNVVPRLKTGTKYLKRRLEGMENIAIAFPDRGAAKGFARFFGGYPMVLCHKERVGDKRIVQLAEGDPAGRHVVIVDDMIKTGGTTIECRQALVDAGAAKVSAYVTHGSFPKESWKKFLDAGFEKVWITDSCPKTAAAVEGKPPFEVISLAESIAHVIAR